MLAERGFAIIRERWLKMIEKELQPLPTGTSDFVALRDAGQIYVDKTEQIYRLASLRQKFFLTRPRRFGKSLLVSTFASLFRDGLKYFSGLAIEKLWKDSTYNVIEIDFSKVKGFFDYDDFTTQVRSVVAGAFAQGGFVLDENKKSEWIAQISNWMSSQPVNSVVLLIDEYDAPHTACLENKELFNKVRALLSSFYAIVKSNDACLRFVFMTGITKFNQTGIFSELNNFTDLSLSPHYGTFLGYSEDDIRRYFAGYLTRAAQELCLSEEEVLNRMRDNYDGYCFDQKVSTHVYAPWSVMKFLEAPDLGFSNYWMKSGGTLTLLEKYLHSHALKSPAEYGELHGIRSDVLDSASDFDSISDLALLTQAGYLTIKRSQGRTFFVGYPNFEVADSMASLYTNMLLRNETLETVGAGGLESALKTANIPEVFQSANKAFAALDYQQYPIINEKYCQAFLQVFIFGANYDVTAEKHTAFGRSDLEFDADKYHWVIELKFQRKKENAEALLSEAVDQIRDRNYGSTSSKELVRVAAVFSEEKRAFVCWQEVPA